MSAAGVLAGATLAVSTAPAAAAPGPTLELQVDPNASIPVDVLPAGKSPGDRYAINAVVRDGAGTAVGTLRAAQTSIRLQDDAETVQAEGIFALADGSIVFAGVAASPLRATGLTVGPRFTRAVIGGTGRYAGAGGTLVSSKRADGVYEQTLTLVLPDGAPSTVRVPGLEGAAEERIDLGGGALGPGDLIAISGEVAGPAAGTIAGTQSVLAPDANDLIVLSSLTFGLADGDLSVVGLSAVPADGATLVAGRTFERAVVGGTRGFVGRGGTQTVVRGDDGQYANALRMWAPRGKVLRLRTRARNTTSATVDLGVPGPSAGDVVAFQDVVTDAGGKRLGRLNGTRTTVTTASAAAENVQTLITFDLRGGTIVVGGVSRAVGGPIVRPVLGGTGRYEGMRGSMRSVPGPGGTYVNDLRLQRIG